MANALRLGRGSFLAGATALAVAGGIQSRAGAAGSADLKIRWYGGGVYELATPDDATIVLVDAWIWNNTGYTRFGMTKPPELASAAAYSASIKSRNPKSVIIALTHDHGDHMGDYFELLQVLTNAGIDVKTVGQSDLMRVGLIPKFKAADLDETKLVLNNGSGINMGGVASYGGAKFTLVPAVHSTALGYPAAGFIIDIGGVRVYASGDTDLFGDMTLIGQRYAPDLAFVSAGGGPYTMGPQDAAQAVKMVGAASAIPVHYGHNPLVGPPETGDAFRAAMTRVAPQVAVTVMKPGQALRLSVATKPRA